MTTDALSAAAACVLGTSLAACATTPHHATGEAQAARVMVKLVRPAEHEAAIAAEATRIAGVPVRHAAAASPIWHALSLHCGDAAGCEAAIARLRAATATYETVELDSRKTRSAS